MLFARCSPFTYAFSYAISHSSRRILPILASFLTFLRLSLCSLYTFYFLLSLVTLPLSFQPIFTQTLSPRTWIITISSGWKVLALPVLLLYELIRNRKILRITVRQQPHPFYFALKTRVANYLLTRLRIYQPTWNPRVMPDRVLAARSTKGRHSRMRTSLSSTVVS